MTKTPQPQAQPQEEKKFWEGSNFYIVLGLAIVSASTLAMEEAQAQLTFLVEGVFAGLYLIKQLVTGKFSFKNFQMNNGWNYVAQIVVLVAPQFAELVPGLKSLVEALVNQDWAAVISALFSIGTILFYIFTSDRNRAELARISKSVVGISPGV